MINIEEAINIANMCEKDLFPPTNPLILLNSAITIFKEKGNNKEFKQIIDWLSCLTDFND